MSSTTNTSNVKEVHQTAEEGSRHDTLKYSLLGPSLTKAGQDTVDQQKVNASHVIYLKIPSTPI